MLKGLLKSVDCLVKVCRSVEIYGINFQSVLKKCGEVWRSMEKYGEVWSCMELCVVFSETYLRKSMEYLGKVWSFLEIEK